MTKTKLVPVTNQHRSEGLDLVADVHVLEVLDLAVHRSGQQDLLALIRGIPAQLDRQRSSCAFLLVVKVQAGMHVPVGVASEVHSAAEIMETPEHLLTVRGPRRSTGALQSMKRSWKT